VSVQFGVTQGRLVPSRTGELQCFPQDDWAAEFAIAARLGLQYVELLAERQHNPDNPLWSAAGVEAIAERAQSAGLRLYSTINDYVLNHDLATARDALDQSLRWVDVAAALRLRMLVVPLMDASDPAGRDAGLFVRPLREIADRAAGAGLDVCLETIMPTEALMDLIARVDRPRVGICFDTGNRSASGYDIYAELPRIAPMLRHVHVKDKASGQNVLLGTGQVNFQRVAEALMAMAYDGAFTFEAPRGIDPAATGAYHLAMLRFFLEEAGLLPRPSSSLCV
jgi:sugar phosphate isomerase/epimerase